MLPVRKESVDIIRRLPEEKLYLLRDYATRLDDESLTVEEIVSINEGKPLTLGAKQINSPLPMIQRRYSPTTVSTAK